MIVKQLIAYKPAGRKFNVNLLKIAKNKFNSGLSYLFYDNDDSKWIYRGAVNGTDEIHGRLSDLPMNSKLEDQDFINNEAESIVIFNDDYQRREKASFVIDDKNDFYSILATGDFRWLCGSTDLNDFPAKKIHNSMLKYLNRGNQESLIRNLCANFKEDSYLLVNQTKNERVKLIGKWEEMDGVFFSTPDFKSFKYDQKTFLIYVLANCMLSQKDEKRTLNDIIKFLKSMKDSELEKFVLTQKNGKILLDRAYSLE